MFKPNKKKITDPYFRNTYPKFIIIFTEHHFDYLYVKYLESEFLTQVSLSYVRVDFYRALHLLPYIKYVQ